MILTELFDADTGVYVHPLPVLWYFISISLWWYLCSCAHTMFILYSAADAVNAGSWPILFKVLTLNVTIHIALLNSSSFCLCLSSAVNFSNTGARAPVSAECALILPARRAMRFGHMVWVSVMVIFRWPYFYLINRRHPYRWVTVISWLNN